MKHKKMYMIGITKIMFCFKIFKCLREIESKKPSPKIILNKIILVHAFI